LKLERKSIDINVNLTFKDFKFSDEVLLRGTFKPTKELTKIQYEHFLDILTYHLISINERKIRFQFRLVMRPDIGEINFDGECILESPEQNKIEFLMQNTPQPLRNIVDTYILKNSYYHAESFAKKENFPFLPVKELLIKFGIK